MCLRGAPTEMCQEQSSPPEDYHKPTETPGTPLPRPRYCYACVSGWQKTGWRSDSVSASVLQQDDATESATESAWEWACFCQVYRFGRGPDDREGGHAKSRRHCEIIVI